MKPQIVGKPAKSAFSVRRLKFNGGNLEVAVISSVAKEMISNKGTYTRKKAGMLWSEGLLPQP